MIVCSLAGSSAWSLHCLHNLNAVHTEGIGCASDLCSLVQVAACLVPLISPVIATSWPTSTAHVSCLHCIQADANTIILIRGSCPAGPTLYAFKGSSKDLSIQIVA